METFKKNWITYLGIAFLFLGFLYFLKMAIDEAWVPPLARVAIGLALGVTGTFFGYTMYKKQLSLSSEIIAGLGVGVMFATFGYASFSNEIAWSANTLFIAMIATTAAVTYISTRHSMRILMFISVFGGLLTPIVIKAQESQVWVLFFFVLLINLAALYISAIKNWKELRVMSFITTVIIYVSYYMLFDPQDWKEPIFYLSSLFVTYLAGLIVASVKDDKNFEGANLYLNILNGINFVFWSILILDQFELAYAFPAIFTGFLFIITAIIIYNLSNGSKLAPAVYALLGIVIMAIATGDLGYHYTTAGMHYVISTAVWLLLISLTFSLGEFSKNAPLKKVSVFAWMVLLAFWFANAWDVEWVRWFGVEYIPFINPGALVWIALATTGFIASRLLEKESESPQNSAEKGLFRGLSKFMALMAHVVVGGLLTVQIQNLWMAYEIDVMRIDLILSVMWLFYAMTIFLWGAYTRDTTYRVLGTVVLLFTTTKIFFWDLDSASSVQRVVFLMVAGALTLGISYINNRWAKKSLDHTNNETSSSQGDDVQGGGSVLSPEEKEWI